MNRTSCVRIPGRVFAPLLAFAIGCGGGGAYNNSVEGVVTLDGKPLGNVVVSFVPQSQGGVQPPVSIGRTDEQGRFRLQCKRNGSAEEPGAFLGTHSVLVTEPAADRKNRSEDPDAKAAAAPTNKRVPSQYGVPGSTPLTVEVTAEKHEYSFDLKSR
jgi:hypothetical protein